ncbi:MAG: sigma-54-dependent Fis family transcriptional regulator [Candidatus Hydrogenedentes bacterium]|nr:sigma-54-dependent Fis family transcriptional regulator [Candidatus Hydrogenedentota bacterium]
MQTILIVDDEDSVRQSLRMIFQARYRVLMASTVDAALEILQEQQVHLVLLDLMLSGGSGFEVLRHFNERGRLLPVVVITANASVESAVQAMKHGARDYVVKPFDVDQLREIVQRQIMPRTASPALRLIDPGQEEVFSGLVGGAPAFVQALERARQAMRVDSSVLITGESGTGKDLLAQAIHNGSRRATGPFVAIACCAIPDALVEAELFGHVKGAYTGANDDRIGKVRAADGGTLFLDEIGDMPLEGQAKLLRVLQEGRFYPVGGTDLISTSLRVVCATNRNLRAAIDQGRFREDLYYRINVFPIEMPALRHRREDIPMLVAHFLSKHRSTDGEIGVSPRAMSRMMAYDWPGNIRELENLVLRLLAAWPDLHLIRTRHLEEVFCDSPDGNRGTFQNLEGMTLADATHHVERYMIEQALAASNGVQSRAAELLGTTRRILKYKMDQLGIEGISGDSLAG